VADTGRAAVLGRPIHHSLSPVLHRAAYAALNLDWSYDAIDCGADDLAEVLAARADWAGFSCTMPLKHAAVRVAARITARAEQVGAANTLLPDGSGGWRADNTDVHGILAALAEHAVRPASVAVLGGGGTAQAALVATRELGVSSCVVLVRDRARAAGALAAAERAGLTVRVAAFDVAAAELDADLIISTVPAGAADVLADRPWRSGQAVLDVVYSPWPTQLSGAARDAGATVVSGAAMLLHQAAGQVELMTGRSAPTSAMRSALRSALGAPVR
jgi:shikimate dehydrogenase